MQIMTTHRLVRTCRALATMCLLLPILASLSPASAPSSARQATPQSTAQPALAAAYARLPLVFTPDQGEANLPVRFLARGRDATLSLSPDEIALTLSPPSTPRAASPLPVAPVLRFAFPGANPQPTLTAEAPLPGTVNFFLGDDPARWRTNIPTSARVRYTALYPGIDLVVYGNQGGEWEYDVIVAPGADPTRFALTMGGAERVALDSTGALVIATGSEEIRQHAPVIYQEVAGVRQPVAGGYTIRQDGTVGFVVGEYDRSAPLVIDPVVYGTYVGGTGTDVGADVAVDSAGNVYITGNTSAPFPTTAGAYQTTFGGGSDGFVTKLNASGTAPLYSTYLGGNDNDFDLVIAVDTAGNAYITGATGSTNFPTTPGAYQTTFPGAGFVHGFVTKLNATGTALLYSTYLGGSGGDGGSRIMVDSAGNAYVIGLTNSTNFPVTPGAYQTTFGGGGYDVFVVKFSFGAGPPPPPQPPLPVPKPPGTTGGSPSSLPSGRSPGPANGTTPGLLPPPR